MTAMSRLLKDYRARRGMSQEKLARAAHISMSTMLRLEGGRARPDADNLFNLADALGVPYTEVRAAVAEDSSSPAPDVPTGLAGIAAAELHPTPS